MDFRASTSTWRLALCVGLLLALVGCKKKQPPQPKEEPEAVAAEEAPAEPEQPHLVDSRPPPMVKPVDYWQHGKTERKVDAVEARANGHIILDLGEEWTPYLFTERGNDSEQSVPNDYRSVFLMLARGEIPPGDAGKRAREDEYLEPYGIPPTLGLLRKRTHDLAAMQCVKGLDLKDFNDFSSYVGYSSTDSSTRDARRFDSLAAQVRKLLQREHQASIENINRDAIEAVDRDLLTQYERVAPRNLAVRAMQTRLSCEGYFRGLGRYTTGAFDWATHLALSKFEKRHRIYGWGTLSKETLDSLKLPTLELERQDLIRVLTERAMLAAGVIEDGSTLQEGDTIRSFTGRDGHAHPMRNLEDEVRQKVIESFGLQTPESTIAFLDSLGELPADQAHFVAIDSPTLPEYYDTNMELSVEVDRGDVWYDFPYDEHGREQPQGVERRPHLTIFVTYQNQRIPLARYGTTIGGWRSEYIDDQEWWKYKNSPAGPVVWTEIVSAPIWIPPESTPPRELLERAPRSAPQDYQVKYDEIGPSYASAYGLVAAYHHPYERDADGRIRVTGDEGIRTHGSVDYTSIMRRHSHGCHRLHNHIAIRLMSFVLAHRAHQRVGEQHVNFTRPMEYKDEQYELKIENGGYVFKLDRPIPVEVLEGRVRGDLAEPVTIAIPKYNTDVGAYMMPDGTAVVFRDGELVPVPLPPGAAPEDVPQNGAPDMAKPPDISQTVPASGAPL